MRRRHAWAMVIVLATVAGAALQAAAAGQLELAAVNSAFLAAGAFHSRRLLGV